MIINREKAKKVFDEYVKMYDSDNEMIKLKIDHTYRVSKLCEKIAFSLGFNKNDIDIAWLLGLLHDIGRFEQVKRYGTFNDALSIDHAVLGVDILFNENKIRDFVEDDSEDQLIKKAIQFHNAYKVPEEFSKRFMDFCNLLRDADKIDIFKVNIMVPPEYVYGVSKDELYDSTITQEVMEDFKKKNTVLRKLKRTAVDNLVGHISLIFGLVYNESIEIAMDMGDFQQLLEFRSKNNITNRQFKEIRELTNKYINYKIESR